MEFLFLVMVSMALTIPLTIWEGFVISKLWLWFIVPVFALPVLSISTAIGIALVFSILTHQHPRKTGEPDVMAEVGHQFWIGLANPFILLVFGAVVHAFM